LGSLEKRSLQSAFPGLQDSIAEVPVVEEALRKNIQLREKKVVLS
jgi:hypothetical protein